MHMTYNMTYTNSQFIHYFTKKIIKEVKSENIKNSKPKDKCLLNVKTFIGKRFNNQIQN